MVNGKKKTAPGIWTRDLEKEKFWRKKIAEYAISGISIQEFCRLNGIATGSFGAWKRELLIRDRESIASGDTRATTPLPILPGKVKDSRGRIIPTKFRNWIEETKNAPVTESFSPFVPLKLVSHTSGAAEPEILADSPSTNQIEVISPGGYTIKLSNQADAEFVSKLLHSLEAKRC